MPNTPSISIIFDLDGTLLDTLTDIANAANDALSQMGFPTHSIPEYRFMVGDGVSMLFQRALPQDQRSTEAVHQGMELFEAFYQHRWNQTSCPYAGIPEILDLFRERNVRTAVLSNKPHLFTEKCVAEFLHPWKFDLVLGQQAHRPRKPDPAGVHVILEAWKLEAKSVFYWGDTNTDMMTAVSAGCRPVGVTWGFRSEQELRDSGAEIILHHPSDFLPYL